MSSVHSILNKYDWSLNEIKILLENDASSVNSIFLGLTPLHRVLKNKNSSIDVVKCLLHYGANPNSLGWSDADNHPVLLSLRHRRDKDIIKLLLEVGSQVGDTYDKAGHSPLCIALRHGRDIDLIQMLLDAGCSPRKRPNHFSALQCSMSFPSSKIRADICKLLIREDASFLYQDNGQKRSFMCYALSCDAETEVIKLLMEAGCSLNACKVHYSAMGCAVDHSGILKKDTIQLLLDAGVKVGYLKKFSESKYHNILMHHVLEISNCELDIIKLLYDCVNDDFPNDWLSHDLLHCAARNRHCKPEVLQFLIDQGANARQIEYTESCTPLHIAVRNDNCQAAVIEVLLRNGCPANRETVVPTALKVALDKRRDLNVIEELLKGGCRLAAAGNVFEILLKALEKYDKQPSLENINFVKILLKYAYLEYPIFDIKVWDLAHKHYSLFSHLISECMREIKILKSMNAFQFIRRHSDYKPKAKANQLLKVSSINTFAVYFDVISITYGREAMERRLQVQPMYCMTNGSNPRKVILNYDIGRKITDVLVDEDLFSLLVALFNSHKPTYYAKEKKTNIKRCSEEPYNLRKRSRQSY